MSSMISIVRSFGAPVIEPPGKHARTQSTGVRSRSSTPGDRRDQLVHRRVGLDDHELRHAHGVDLADASEVVAQQVDDHQVLGERLLVAAAARRAAPRRDAGSAERGAVPLIGRACTRRSRSTDRKRSGEELSDGQLAELQVGGERRRVAPAQQRGRARTARGSRRCRSGRSGTPRRTRRRPAPPGSARCRPGTARARARSGNAQPRSAHSRRPCERARCAGTTPRGARRASAARTAASASLEPALGLARPRRDRATSRCVRCATWSTATTRLASISTASGTSERWTLGEPQSALHS